MELNGFTEVSAILGPGVYALVKRGVVIYVGKSKSLWQRLYAHRNVARNAARGKAIPTWMPIKGFVFDQVFVLPCPVADLDRLESEMVERYKPRFNESLKSHRKIATPIPLQIGGVQLMVNPGTSPAESFRRI